MATVKLISGQIIQNAKLTDIKSVGEEGSRSAIAHIGGKTYDVYNSIIDGFNDIWHEQITTINWQTTSDKDKICRLMTDVLRWPCYESWAEYRQRPNKDKPAAIWEDQGGGNRYWSVFHQPFNPLRRIEDAWQIVLHLRAVDQDVMENFANALAYSLLDFLQHGSAEDICIAALKAVGYQIQEKVNEQARD